MIAGFLVAQLAGMLVMTPSAPPERPRSRQRSRRYILCPCRVSSGSTRLMASVGEIVEADDVEEEDDQLILTKSGAVVAIFAKRSVQGWWITDSLR